MIKKYLSLVSTITKKNSKIYNIKLFPIFIVVISYISYALTPLFITLRLSANFITGVNFIISIMSIYCIISLDNNLFCYGIYLYILFRVLDVSDGTIARHTKTSSFYGRFLDAILDIFYQYFLTISVTFFISSLYKDNSILYAGVVVSVFSTFSSCIHDKYSSLARWSNLENKTKIIPYLRRSVLPRIQYIGDDITAVALISLPFLLNNSFMLYNVFLIYLSVIFLTSIINILKHIVSAQKNFKILARDRNYYAKKTKKK